MFDLEISVLLATSSMPAFHKNIVSNVGHREEDRFLFQIDCVVILVVPIHLRIHGAEEVDQYQPN